MSPRPRSCSAPLPSRTVRESTLDATWKAMRVGKFALINPVTTSTEGRWVAMIRSEELLGAVAVEDRPRVHLGRDLEGDARGEVRLDQPRDYVHRGPLGRDDPI